MAGRGETDTDVREYNPLEIYFKAYISKQKYPGMFETQKSGNKASSSEIGLNIRTLASPKMGQDPFALPNLTYKTFATGAGP